VVALAEALVLLLVWRRPAATSSQHRVKRLPPLEAATAGQPAATELVTQLRQQPDAIDRPAR
jgi:hypothetical protein